MRIFRDFLSDERGAYTIWSLVWFALYVVMGGVAVDMTDAYRTQTKLQATADAAALAGVMSLPDQDDAIARALDYAFGNMAVGTHGGVLVNEDVTLGVWDFKTRTFIPTTVAPNAVYVVTRRAQQNSNPLPTNFLRITKLFGIDADFWNINVEAVAARFVPGCIRAGNAFIAGNRADFTSNNVFENTCVHGQNMVEDPGHDYAVEIQNNGTIGDNVQISMPDLDELTGRPTVCSNDGLCEQNVLVAGDMFPKDAFVVDKTIAGMLDPTEVDYLPDDLNTVDPDTANILPPAYEYIDLSDCAQCVEVPPPVEYDPITGDPLPPDPIATRTYEYTAVMNPNTVYAISCNDAMDQLILPDPTIQPVLLNVAVVSECRLKGPSNMQLEGVALASSAVGGGSKPYDKATIHFSAGTTFGRQDNCLPGGGVAIYSGASVHIAASGTIDGMRIVARGDVKMTANQTANGLVVEAGNNIQLTANADIGTGCSGGVGGLVEYHYRLVQ